jgi:hypothetical protein
VTSLKEKKNGHKYSWFSNMLDDLDEMSMATHPADAQSVESPLVYNYPGGKSKSCSFDGENRAPNTGRFRPSSIANFAFKPAA